MRRRSRIRSPRPHCVPEKAATMIASELGVRGRGHASYISPTSHR
jgi:hypothetical protein